jgi:hypothetical protein
MTLRLIVADGPEVDIVPYEARRREIAPPWSVPTAQVTIGMHERVAAEPAPFPQHDSLAVSALDRRGAVATIAAWLRAHVDVGISDDERRKLEVVLREVMRQIDAGAFDKEPPDEVAQAQAAADTTINPTARTLLLASYQTAHPFDWLPALKQATT